MADDEKKQYSQKDMSELLRDIEETVKRRQAREDERASESPAKLYEAVKKNRTLPGEGSMNLCGAVVDVHAIEDFFLAMSGTDLMSLVELENIRTVRQVLADQHEVTAANRKPFPWFWVLLAILIAGVALLVMFVFGPQILGFFKGMKLG